jgi:hypothetical protein
VPRGLAAHNVVAVQVPEPETVAAAARSSFGDAVRVSAVQNLEHAVKKTRFNGSVRLATARQVADRRLDGTPFYAGNRLVWINGNEVWQCTSGYHSGNATVMFTAGHCFPINAVVRQGFFDEGTNTVRWTQMYGNVRHVEWGNNRIDAESVAAAAAGQLSAARIWSRAATSTQSTATNSWAMSTVGSTVCADGSFTGEVCRGIVQIVNGCTNVDNFTVCGVSTAQAPAGVRLVQHGDSGGPVFRRDVNGRAITLRVISAGNVGQGQPGDRMVYTEAFRMCQIDVC